MEHLTDPQYPSTSVLLILGHSHFKLLMPLQPQPHLVPQISISPVFKKIWLPSEGWDLQVLILWPVACCFALPSSLLLQKHMFLSLKWRGRWVLCAHFCLINNTEWNQLAPKWLICLKFFPLKSSWSEIWGAKSGHCQALDLLLQVYIAKMCCDWKQETPGSDFLLQ